MFDFLYINPILSVSLLSWAAAQLIKTVLYFIINKKFSPERLTGAGGMPSSHSSLVCSLAIITLRTQGVTSPVFAVAIILAMIVMYDAMGVRRAAGMHAKEINRLRKIVCEIEDELDEPDDNDLDEDDSDVLENKEETSAAVKDLKELLGHTPFEVLGGALLGILIGMSFPL